MRKRLRAFLIALLAAALPAAAAAQSLPPTVSQSGTITTTGATLWMPLSGQSVCFVVTAGNGAGMTIVPQVTSDSVANIAGGTAVAVTASTIGAGSISANGTNGGNIAAQGIAAIRLNVTAFGSGTETYTITCSNASAGGGGGGGAVTGPLGSQTAAASVAVTIQGYGGSNLNAQGLNQNLVSVNGTTLQPAINGLPTLPTWQANGGAGGCVGQKSNIYILRLTLTQTLTASTGATQLVAGATGAIHICHISISGVTSTGGNVNLIGGEGVNCATNTKTFWTYVLGTSSDSFVADNPFGIMESVDNVGTIASTALCYSTGAFVSTVTPVLNITYAQY